MTFVPHRRRRYRTSQLRPVLAAERERMGQEQAASLDRQRAAMVAAGKPCEHSPSQFCRKCLGVAGC